MSELSNHRIFHPFNHAHKATHHEVMLHFRLLYSLFPVLFLLACLEQQGEETRPVTERTLTPEGAVHFIHSGGDTLSTLHVAIADDESSRRAGLMNIHSMDANQGMLFLFDEEAPLSFWMANTPLALDIVFADAEGVIVRIHRHTQPYSDRQLESIVPALYAVETNAGYTQEHDIQEGSRILIDR